MKKSGDFVKESGDSLKESDLVPTTRHQPGQSAFGRTVSGLLGQQSEFTPLQLGTNLDSQVEVTQIVNPSKIAISKKGDKQRTVGDKQRTVERGWGGKQRTRGDKQRTVGDKQRT